MIVYLLHNIGMFSLQPHVVEPEERKLDQMIENNQHWMKITAGSSQSLTNRIPQLQNNLFSYFIIIVYLLHNIGMFSLQPHVVEPEDGKLDQMIENNQPWLRITARSSQSLTNRIPQLQDIFFSIFQHHCVPSTQYWYVQLATTYCSARRWKTWPNDWK